MLQTLQPAAGSLSLFELAADTWRIASTEVSDGAQPVARTEFIYDNPSTTGNLIQKRIWDSTKGAYSNRSRP